MDQPTVARSDRGSHRAGRAARRARGSDPRRRDHRRGLRSPRGHAGRAVLLPTSGSTATATTSPPQRDSTGAVAFICEHSLGSLALGAPQLVVTPGSGRAAMARAASAFFGDPASSLRTVGVTGTNGKTTTTYLLRSILDASGWRTGVIGTLAGARTTPESPDLHRGLARQRDAGCMASAIEVTSHALVQHRVDDIVFDIAVFTNLSQDHLDYHENMEAYFDAKAQLFTPEHATLGVVNADDPYGRRLIDRPQIPTVAFSPRQCPRPRRLRDLEHVTPRKTRGAPRNRR